MRLLFSISALYLPMGGGGGGGLGGGRLVEGGTQRSLNKTHLADRQLEDDAPAQVAHVA